jgi:hypothetical protein
MRNGYTIVDRAEQPNITPALPDYADTARQLDYAPRRPLPRLLWLVGAVVALPLTVAAYLLMRPIGEHFAHFTERYSSALFGLFLVFTLVLLLTLVYLLFCAAAWIRNKASVAAVIRLENDHPILVSDLEQDYHRSNARALAGFTLQQHYAVQASFAEQSALRGLGSYSPSISMPAPKASTADGPAIVKATMLPFTDGKSKLEQLRERGIIGRDPRTLYIGHDDDGQPVLLDTRFMGALAIAGKPRSGKTTSAKLLLAQAAMLDWYVIMCDPHGAQPHGLLNQTQHISGACIRLAIEPDEIISAIELADKIGKQRLANPSQVDRPVLLVVDEFTSLIMRGLLPKELLAKLTAIAVEMPKVQVHIALIAHDWSKHALGGTQHAAPLRRAITHKLLHRSDPQNAEFLLGDTQSGALVQKLDRGRALFWGDDSPLAASVPLIGLEDMLFAAQGKPPRPYQRRISLPAMLAAPIPAKQLATTEPLPQATPRDLVLSLLADGQRRNLAEIAQHIGLDNQAANSVLYQMHQAGAIKRDGTRRKYMYYL